LKLFKRANYERFCELLASSLERCASTSVEWPQTANASDVKQTSPRWGVSINTAADHASKYEKTYIIRRIIDCAPVSLLDELPNAFRARWRILARSPPVGKTHGWAGETFEWRRAAMSEYVRGLAIDNLVN
jgi:hypothetical protein